MRSDSREPRSSRAAASLLVTGCYRSGTTLLEKLLHQHPDVCIASQPFPDLYFYCKAAFDRSRGLERRYPLGHLFLEDGYEPSDLDRFLREHAFGDREVNEVFARMSANPLGLWTPEILDHVDQVRPGTFWELFRQLNDIAAGLFGLEDSAYVGSKEVLCEEYLPHLLGQGARAIVVIRDPRDMISSLHFGSRDNKTGDDRPVLFSVRVWRKSVAYCLGLEDHPGFLWLRYEDLVHDVSGQLSRIAAFLGLEGLDAQLFREGIRNQDGSLWAGNSSFEDRRGVDRTSIGRYRESLPDEVVSFIEACCHPEMALLGYDTVAWSDFDEAAIRGYRDPFARIHRSFPADYSSDVVRVANEVARHEQLTRGQALDPAQQRRWYLFERAYERLRR